MYGENTRNEQMQWNAAKGQKEGEGSLCDSQKPRSAVASSDDHEGRRQTNDRAQFISQWPAIALSNTLPPWLWPMA